MNCKTKIEISGLNLEWQTDRGTCTLEKLPLVGMWIDSTLAGLMAGLQAMVGTDRFNLALQSQGRQSIDDDWQVISQYADFASGVAALNHVAVAAGWGIWDLISLDWQKQECHFRIKNTWEGRYQKTLGVCWGSNFVAGKLAGYCSKLFNTNCWAEQTSFIARGDEFDEFVVQPSVRSVEEEIDKLLETDAATRADMAVALKKWQQEAIERQKAEETWRQSEERYRSLVVATSQMVWTTDPQGQVIDMPQWREYTGQTQTEVKGWGWIDAVHPDDREYTMQVAFRALETKSLYETEYRLRAKNGTYRYFAVRAVPVVTADGQVREWIGTCTDIEERKQAEAQLIRYQEQLADLVLERTAELAKTNQKLKEKIIKLQQAESERSIALAQEQAARTRAEALLQERDATLQRLRESEERYRSLVVATSQIVWVTNAEGLEPNMPTWLAYTGQTEAETQNWGWLDAIHPDDRDRAARDWYLAINTKNLYDTEYRLRGADGIYRYFAVRGVPVIDVTDSIREWVGVCTDIHDRKLAEQAIRQSEIKFRTLYESTGAAVMLGDENGFFDCNSAAVRMFGATNIKPLCKKHPAELSPPYQPKGEDSFQLGNQYLEIVFQKGSHSFEWVHRRFDGTDFPTYITLTAIDLGDRKILQAIVQDLTERKQAEEALRQSEEKFRALYESTSLAVGIGDEHGLFDCNTAYMQLLGCTDPKQLERKHPSEISPPYQPNGRDSFSLANEMFALAFKRGSHHFEWVHRRLDGTDFPVEIVLTAIEVNNKKIFQAVVQDLTERKAAEEYLRRSEARERERSTALEKALHQLQSTQAQLIQSEKMSSLGQLVAGVAHEINNPVNFIYANLNYANQYAEEMMELLRLYQDHYPQPATEIQHRINEIDIDFLILDFPKLLSSMKVGAERIREIVLSLRNFSRLDEAEMKEVNIHEGIDSTLMILQNRFKSQVARTSIQVIKEYGSLPPVECYPGQLNQVFMNLLTNALDALENWKPGNLEKLENLHPIVRIQTEVNNLMVTIRIIDNGPGMKAEIRNRLFDPFFTTKPVGKGTGLGLSISYQIIVEKHGGTLKCISELGKGAEFVIQIPIRQSR